jgi:phospholipid/cholesterol/gamma-HCH transport system ATP-binding protein
MNETILEAENLTIGWGTRTLLEDIHFSVQRKDVFVILGGSGSGKSTLLRHLIGLEEPLRGTIRLAGRETVAGGEGSTRTAPPFGVMFQSGALLGSLSVGENVALPLTEWTSLPEDAVAALVRAKLRLVGLEGTEDKMPAELSGGMKKRAAIARALALESELIFLDEPSAGLDPITSAELDLLIQSLNTDLGVTVVMVTHELDSLLAVGTRCILLDREEKGIIAQGHPRELYEQSDDPRVRAFFHRSPLARPRARFDHARGPEQEKR